MTAEQADDAGMPVDEVDSAHVGNSEVAMTGRLWEVRRDTVRMPGGSDAVREYIRHPGAVGIIALDAEDRVALVRQYRHPVGSFLWEAPAGLLDVEGEPPLRTAQRELYEEAHLCAASWHVLVDYYNSPGSSSEAFRCYLARDISTAAGERHAGEDEERDMPLRWFGLDDLVAGVLRGDLHNPTTVSGVLATHAARATGWSTLRPAEAPWPERFPTGGLPPG